MTLILENGQPDRLIVQALDLLGTGVTGASLTISIQDISDNFWYNGVTFVAGFSTNAMAELDATNLPGVYFLDFTSPRDDVTLQYFGQTTTLAVANAPYFGQIQVGQWVEDVIVTRKHVKNKMNIGVPAAGRYTIYEDDKVTPHQLGDISTTERNPD